MTGLRWTMLDRKHLEAPRTCPCSRATTTELLIYTAFTLHRRWPARAPKASGNSTHLSHCEPLGSSHSARGPHSWPGAPASHTRRASRSSEHDDQPALSCTIVSQEGPRLSEPLACSHVTVRSLACASAMAQALAQARPIESLIGTPRRGAVLILQVRAAATTSSLHLSRPHLVGTVQGAQGGRNTIP